MLPVPFVSLLLKKLVILPLAMPLVFPMLAGVLLATVLLLPISGVVDDVRPFAEAIIGIGGARVCEIEGGVGGRPVEGSRGVVTGSQLAASRGLRNMAGF